MFEIDELAAIEMAIDRRMNKLNYEFDMLMLEHRQNLCDIECKVLLENGTEDDLVHLYTTEAEETGGKSKGILTKIFEAIKNFLRKIKDFLFGNKEEIREEDMPEQVTVPEDPEKLETETRETIGKLKGFFTSHENEIKVVGKAAGISAVVIGGKKAFKWLTVKLANLLNDVQGTIDDSEKKLEGSDLSAEKQGVLKSLLNSAKNCAQRLGNCGKAIKSSAKSPKIDTKGKNPFEVRSEYLDQIGDLEREYDELSEKMKALRNKMNGHDSDKVKSKRDQKNIKKLQEIEGIAPDKRSKRQKDDYEYYVSTYGITGEERKKYTSMINELDERRQRIKATLNKLYKSFEKYDKKVARKTAKNENKVARNAAKNETKTKNAKSNTDLMSDEDSLL